VAFLGATPLKTNEYHLKRDHCKKEIQLPTIKFQGIFVRFQGEITRWSRTKDHLQWDVPCLSRMKFMDSNLHFCCILRRWFTRWFQWFVIFTLISREMIQFGNGANLFQMGGTLNHHLDDQKGPISLAKWAMKKVLVVYVVYGVTSYPLL